MKNEYLFLFGLLVILMFGGMLLRLLFIADQVSPRQQNKIIAALVAAEDAGMTFDEIKAAAKVKWGNIYLDLPSLEMENLIYRINDRYFLT